ncbi:hypothetical protein LY76DRAFT_596942 [Colletotrichum caudatum]|nr:hypothetical protein LY76DRAFT_596942 [Colletotrichum caudatum]
MIPARCGPAVAPSCLILLGQWFSVAASIMGPRPSSQSHKTPRPGRAEQQAPSLAALLYAPVT